MVGVRLERGATAAKEHLKDGMQKTQKESTMTRILPHPDADCQTSAWPSWARHAHLPALQVTLFSARLSRVIPSTATESPD